MNADAVIAAYVTEVVLQLPRRQRNDVALELGALLAEGLQDRAEDSGRGADAAMAVEFLNAFGRPDEVAARYRPALHVIDPADGRAFARWCVLGLLAIWFLGLLPVIARPQDSGVDLLSALGHWWVATVIPSLWWPGALVAGFAIAAWSRRRWPPGAWTPRAEDRLVGGRVAKAMAIVGILCGTCLLLDPSLVLDVLFDGRAAPVAYEALSYTPEFGAGPGPWLLGLLLLYLPLYAAMLVTGRRGPWLRRLEAAHGIALCAATAWAALAGPVFMSRAADGLFRLALLASVALFVGEAVVRRLRRVNPAPAAPRGG